MGKLNFGNKIPRFYPMREIRENVMHTKIKWFTVSHSHRMTNQYQRDFQLISLFGC